MDIYSFGGTIFDLMPKSFILNKESFTFGFFQITSLKIDVNKTAIFDL